MEVVKPLPLQLWHTRLPDPLQMGQRLPVPIWYPYETAGGLKKVPGLAVAPAGAATGVSFLNFRFWPVPLQPKHCILPVPEQDEQV